jgi:hypothetical protein
MIVGSWWTKLSCILLYVIWNVERRKTHIRFNDCEWLCLSQSGMIIYIYLRKKKWIECF